MISEERIGICLTSSRFGRELFVFRSLDSTNVHARHLAEHGAPEGSVVIAEQQTAGKGRLGRSWLSNPGENLTFSLILRPLPSQSAPALLPLAVGVAIARAVESHLGLRLACKWPNDLLLEGLKVAGILMETSLDSSGAPYIVVGIGLNVNQTFFPEEIRNRATSLKAWTRTDVDRERLLCNCLAELESIYDRSMTEGGEFVLREWHARSALLGHTVTVMAGNQETTGVVKGVSQDGALVLRAGGIDRLFFAGEVTLTMELPDAAGH